MLWGQAVWWLQPLGHSQRSPSSCLSSWLPVPGRRQCIGIILRLSPSCATLSPCCFSHGLYRKREEREKKIIPSKGSMLCPLQTGLPWHSHCATQSWVVELLCCHVLFQPPRTSASSLSYCHRSGCHNCLRANSQSVCKPLLPAPRSLAGLPPGRCVPFWIQETAGLLLRKPSCHSLTHARFHREGLEHMAGVSHSHLCSGPSSASLLHCCFPKVVQIGNKRQLGMARTSTGVCFSAPSTPSAPLRRKAYRTGFIPQCLAPAMAQDNFPRSCRKVPDHPGFSIMAINSGEPKKHL